MKMSKDFNKIKDWFVNGFWSEKRVRDAVKMGKITQEECDIILSIKDWTSWEILGGWKALH